MNQIPSKLNIFIAVTSYSLAIFFLYQVHLAEYWYLKLLWAIAFGLINNTIFSLLHESVHGVFSNNKSVNNWFGRFSSAFFPTSFTMQQIFHLGQHRRNRTDTELFEQYYPKDNIFIKKFVIYSLLTGFYWPSSPFANIVFLICPWLFNKDSKFRKNDLMAKASFDDMLSGLDRKSAPHFKMRLEIIFSLTIQIAIIYFLNLTFFDWIITYWTFAILWSSLQYTDHAWSKRSIREGAWNLKVSKATHLIWLNYHYHLNHHKSPNTSWLHLPKITQERDLNPGFWEIYFRLWKGPTPVVEENPTLSNDLNDEIYERIDLNS
ncbi:fatty acid desaturase [Bacteriovoracaceae bacterium]|nr:fatty acid desaturase [Bacteriovoracaceae bacterium]